ncbi:hypothetical protein SAMN05421664_0823 [Chryseobacterium soldanellicola]|uniref:Uncharacterized protein n=1 Tax=Chryseobacterium soldanellicola TaxID=311333 RepID=A0A1H0YMQ1_9FLAO|nr:tetratricopeptide repeat protein [Chryseobacterium soldanellicola]SDQ16403.1 hypothetical protein SAMN05421664_0823 [Chryseobacterium soldanellicola]
MIKKIIFKNSLLLFTFLISNFAVCQKNQFSDIDDLLNESSKKFKQHNDIDALKYAQKANILSKKTGNSERIAKSNYRIASSLASLLLQKQSLYYIEKAEKEPYTKKDIILQALLKEIKSYNYYTLELKSQGKKEMSDILRLLSQKKDTASLRVLFRTYGNIGNVYFDNNKLDSADFYYKLSINLIKGFPENEVTREMSNTYIALGNFQLKKKNSDSALYYFQKAYEINKKYNKPEEFLSFLVYGNYYKEQKEYLKALNYYFKALEKMQKNTVSILPHRDIYSSIAECYGYLNQKDLQKKYQDLFTEKENKALAEKSKNIDYALNNILNDKQEEYTEFQQRKYVWISISILLLLIIFFYFYKLLREKLQHKEYILTEINSNLDEKEKIITEKHIETEELQSKVNDNYNEIIELAKNNDPLFYPRFQEIYPDFQKKLMEISPTLRTSELILCAYTFLGFTIKDVADYTFKSINTIRNRKQNLRKKFNLPTELDLGIWLRNLIEKTRDK